MPVTASMSFDCHRMAKEVLTNWNVSIRRHRELLHYLLWGNPSLAEMTQHLVCSRLVRLVGGSNLDSVVFGMISPNGSDVCSHLAVFELGQQVVE